MLPDYAELHRRIQTFNFDHVNGQVTFTQHLAREHHWTKDYAGRVIGEYRKFLLLATVVGHKVVPSDQVDQAWHLHLLNSRSYWQDLCPKVLGKDLHHRPSPGGKIEQAVHLQDYNQTLDSYERIFGQKAPDNIWPPAEIRFGRDISFVRVNCRDYWMIKKPIINWRYLFCIVTTIKHSFGGVGKCKP
ncbi:conserved hypothetical protein [Crenothrix polyspora]|uniref:Uncharacterized protein n=1 Tax=Crenothrix polyspora TaxID=360316 RepID=A0A1R4H359_9GAMM|nr:hypothetical protein [Crenothrix polyspora]SJM90683.1 conserved hypothetical protein [Crenothrix polyspora]